MNPSFTLRQEVLINIVSVLFHVANMYLWEVLTVVGKSDIEDTIIIYWKIFQKIWFRFIVCYRFPKESISLAALPFPFSITPRIA